MTETQKIQWKRLSVEAGVIVASILFAFAIDAWWDRRQEFEIETAYRQDLLVEMREARAELAGDDERRRATLSVIDSLQKESATRSVPDSTLTEWILLATRNPAFFPPDAVFQDLLLSGNLHVIRSNELRYALSNYSQEHPRLRFVEENGRRFVVSNVMPYIYDHISLTSPEPGDLNALLTNQYFGNMLTERHKHISRALYWSDRIGTAIDKIIDLLEHDPRTLSGDD